MCNILKQRLAVSVCSAWQYRWLIILYAEVPRESSSDILAGLYISCVFFVILWYKEGEKKCSRSASSPLRLALKTESRLFALHLHASPLRYSCMGIKKKHKKKLSLRMYFMRCNSIRKEDDCVTVCVLCTLSCFLNFFCFFPKVWLLPPNIIAVESLMPTVSALLFGRGGGRSLERGFYESVSFHFLIVNIWMKEVLLAQVQSHFPKSSSIPVLSIPNAPFLLLVILLFVIPMSTILYSPALGVRVWAFDKYYWVVKRLRHFPDGLVSSPHAHTFLHQI